MSIDAEKLFEICTLHSFMIQVHNKLKEQNFLKLRKGIYKNPRANTLNGERWKTVLLG